MVFIQERNSKIVPFFLQPEDQNEQVVDIGRMPTSCADLKRMGQKISGFFSVKGSIVERWK
jgi:hypothetical protein